MFKNGYTGNVRNYVIKRGREIKAGDIVMLTGMVFLCLDDTIHKEASQFQAEYIKVLSLNTGDYINLPLYKANGELKEYTIANSVLLERSR